MRAALYLRISKADKGDTAGVDRQEKTCRALADRLGWTTIEPPYIDNDVSATKGKPRPAYERMLADIQAGRVDAILCWQPDRLYRITADLERLVTVVEGQRIPVQTVNAGHVDLSTSTGRMVARILGAVSQQEVELKKERWLESYEQRRVDLQQQFLAGHRLFGFTQDGQIDPDEAAHLRAVVEAMLDGRSMLGACRYLNSREVKTTRGNLWSASALRWTLRNPRLAGHVTLRGEIVHRGVCPAIITDEEHQRLVALLDDRMTGRAKPRKSPLIGLIYCGVCGSNLVTGSRYDGKRSYRCSGVGCGLMVVAEPVEAIVRGYAKERLSDPRIVDELNALRGLSGAAARTILAEIDALEQRRDEIRAALMDSDEDVTVLSSAARGLSLKIRDARARLAAVTPTAAVDTTGPWPEDVREQHERIALVVLRVEIARSQRRGPFESERVRIEPRLGI